MSLQTLWTLLYNLEGSVHTSTGACLQTQILLCPASFSSQFLERCAKNTLRALINERQRSSN